VRRVAVLVAVALLVAACGTKGPLYLPKPDPDPERTDARRPKPN
jgi:predicted small lipoprotein YifL